MGSLCFVENAFSFRIGGQPVARSVSHFSPGFNGIKHSKLRRVPHIARGKPACETPVPVSMTSDSSSTSLIIRIGSVVVVIGLILTTFLPLAGVFRNGASDNGSVLADSLLAKVPIFTVTDQEGRPFLRETEDRRLRQGYFFVQPADAEKYLQNLAERGQENGKVLTIGLNEAVKYLEKSSPATSVPERFELFPDGHEADIARTVTDGNFQKTFGDSAVPIFYIDGLGIKDSKEGETVFPLFFAKEKLDETVKNLKKTDPEATIDLKDLQVIDLQQTIREIRSGSNPSLNRVVFVPLPESLKAMKSQAAD